MKMFRKLSEQVEVNKVLDESNYDLGFNDDIFALVEEVLENNDALERKRKWRRTLRAVNRLPDTVLTDFIKLYYSDDSGRMSDDSYDKALLNRKEKVAQVRQILRNLTPEKKDKVMNHPAVRKAIIIKDKLETKIKNKADKLQANNARKNRG